MPTVRERFQSALISWHRGNERKFSWRATNDPFKIIVAEIALKKTGAWKAEKTYEYLMKQYGAPEKMAKADPSRIQPYFQRLGLFNRSQLLIDIATEIIDRFNGRVPKAYGELVSIKGIGQYIANAVLCFCHGERVPLVDGGIARVYRRHFDCKSSRPPYADKELWKIARATLPEDNVREFNYGLLDLGALICRPGKPCCQECPVEATCVFARSKEVGCK